MQFLIILLNSKEFTHVPYSERNQSMSVNEGAATSPYRSTPHAQPDLMISRSLKISACIKLLHAFLFLRRRSCIVYYSHPLESRASTATMILIADAKDSGSRVILPLVDEVCSVFVDMQRSGVSRIAVSVVEQISRARAELGERCH